MINIEKISDRLIAGVLAGLGANVVKMSIEQTAQALGLTKETGRKKAAGFFLSPRKTNTPKGKFIGCIGDNTVAAFLGVFASYLLTQTGKDYALLKGMVIGNFAWSTMYGIMTQLGVTKVKSNDPNTCITSMFYHTAFGITTVYLLTKIASPELFEPDFKVQETEKGTEQQ